MRNNYQKYLNRYKADSGRYKIKIYHDMGQVVIELSKPIPGEPGMDYALEGPIPEPIFGPQPFELCWRELERMLDEAIAKDQKSKRKLTKGSTK